MTDVEDIIDNKSDDTKQEIKEDWKKITDNKYQSEAELAKAYKDLEKKLGDLSTEIKQGKEFAQVVQPILDEIRNDPEIFDKLDKKLRDKNNPDKKDIKEVPNTEVRDKMSELIVSTFEQRHNFSDLSKDEQTALRNKIGTEILELTGKKLADIDLRQQENILEKAYKLVQNDSQPTNETEDEDQTGAISKVKSSQQKGEGVLTPEEAKVASSLGLSREQYLSGKKK